MTDLDKIREERANIARQRVALDKRDAELAIAEKVVAELSGTFARVTASIEALGYPAPGGSRRDKVLEALSGDALWMTSGEINKAIAARHGLLIKGTSLYPMLTTLKNEGVIVRDGSKMALKSRVDGG